MIKYHEKTAAAGKRGCAGAGIMYQAKLDLVRTERAIKLVKDEFESKLAEALNLTRISAPLFVAQGSGLNDNLNGVERPVSFDVKATGGSAEVVHSLAKWKRYALAKYRFGPRFGLYCDMNAIRRDEDLDALHSIYVDQWDWEVVILPQDRTVQFLHYFPDEITFVTTQELEDKYPDLTPKERECAYVKEHGAAFIMCIGGKLKSGQKHDGRSPDYDDWNLNGDIVLYYPPLGCAFELSSMGIRVDEKSLLTQLEAENCLDRPARAPLPQGARRGRTAPHHGRRHRTVAAVYVPSE